MLLVIWQLIGLFAIVAAVGLLASPVWGLLVFGVLAVVVPQLVDVDDGGGR